MNPVALTIGLSWIGVGLLSISLAVPLVLGRVKRNAYYGVRFPQSFQSDEAWFAINRYGGRALLWWSLPIVVCGSLILFLPLKAQPIAALGVGIAPFLFVLIPLIQSWRFARHWRAANPRPNVPAS